jgi:galactose mutarotase-like enzyme
MENKSDHQQMEQIRLENEYLLIDIIPALGTKICSLINKKTGKQWMDRPEGRGEFRQPSYGSLWEKWDRCGWDELFPSIDACSYPVDPWTNVQIPDHGEVWAMPWACNKVSDLEMHGAVQGRQLPYRLEKQMILNGNQVHFSYRLTNLSEHDMPFLWAPHPIIAATESMRICLPPSANQIVTTVSLDQRLGKWGMEHAWPVLIGENGTQVVINKMPARNSGVADKFYVKSPLQEGWCSVVEEATGEQFKFIFDVKMIPFLAFWVNGGGWNDHYHLAMEPATGYLDNLSIAHAWDSCAFVPGGGVKEWELTLEIS